MRSVLCCGEGCFVTLLCAVSHVALTSCAVASESRMKGCMFSYVFINIFFFLFTEGMRQRVIAKSGLCSAAQSVRHPGSLSDRTGGLLIKDNKKGWLQQGMRGAVKLSAWT